MMHRLLFLLLLVSALHAEEQIHREVVIYGGTPAGVIAAVAAARHGHSVALINVSNHLGGVISGGLTNTDIGNRATVGGLSMEFIERTVNHYRDKDGPESPQYLACKNGRKFEPHIAELTFEQMLKEQPSITVWKSHRYKSVTLDGGRITALVVDDLANKTPRTFTGEVFIDASYEGDLMAGAKVPYRVGREGTEEFGEKLAGISIGPDKGKADKLLMAYNFRVSITPKTENRVLFPKPGHYDPEPFKARFGAKILSGKIKRFADLFISNAGANDKHDANWCDLVDGSHAYPEADWETRARIEAKHRDYFLSLLWYLQNDPELPEAFRTDARIWGLPKDEFADNGHFPYQLYVREARRMVGSYVLRESDLTQNRQKPDGICAGSYGVDCHIIQRLMVDGKSRVDRTPHISCDPYEIPYACLTPREPGNLLVPVCCSATHVAYCSLRMEPTYMMLGHAAGAAAHLSIAGKTTVQKVDTAKLREILTKEGAVLDAGSTPAAVAVKKVPVPVKANPAPSVEITDAQLAADVKVLVEKKIVDEPDYWLNNATQGKACDGAMVSTMLHQMARHFEPATTASDSLQVLIKRKLFRSATYWKAKTIAGGNCGGDNVRTVIHNFVQATKSSPP